MCAVDDTINSPLAFSHIFSSKSENHQSVEAILLRGKTACDQSVHCRSDISSSIRAQPSLTASISASRRILRGAVIVDSLMPTVSFVLLQDASTLPPPFRTSSMRRRCFRSVNNNNKFLPQLGAFEPDVGPSPRSIRQSGGAQASANLLHEHGKMVRPESRTRGLRGSAAVFLPRNS